MEKKIIKIKLEENGDLSFYNNDSLKKVLAADCNEISGKEIIEILDINYGDELEIEPIDEKTSSKRYKMIHELLKDIIEKIVTDEKNISFDADIQEKSPLDIWFNCLWYLLWYNIFIFFIVGVSAQENLNNLMYDFILYDLKRDGSNITYENKTTGTISYINNDVRTTNFCLSWL